MGGQDPGRSREVGRVVPVVARHEEDLGWSDGWAGVVVVQKGRDLPNVGREASSWLWFLETAEIDPDTTYAFLQGDPRPHGVGLLNLRTVDRYTPIGSTTLSCDLDGAPNHPGLQIERRAGEWLGVTVPPSITFRAGAQFLLPGRLALSRPRDWYARLRRAVEEDKTGPWVMERLWQFVWGPPPQHVSSAPISTLPAPADGPMRVRSLLGQGDPYAGLEDTTPPDLRGWVQPNLGDVARRLLDGAPKEIVIAEVGVWKGASTVVLVEAARASGRWAEVVSVDTWLGAPEFWGPNASPNHDLQRVRGFPRVYETFLRNMRGAGVSGQVTPFPISSVQGAEVMRRLGVAPWLVYVDAAHEADAVEADCRAWWPVIPPGGAMFGDDWSQHWPGVEAGVTAWARFAGADVEVDGAIWFVRRRA